NFTHVLLPKYKHKGAQDKRSPMDKVWVVRNLTKRWYVRSDIVDKEAKTRYGLHVTTRPSLGAFVWAEFGGGSSDRSH
ncbi:hypothetical protein CYLTODRAFT_359751, partial [Cylindrobasidium torrendii FP15055 ss-10]